MISLYYQIKDTVDVDKRQLLELFFKDWAEDTGCNHVHYEVSKNQHMHSAHRGAFRLDFECTEDLVALKLRGVPLEFRNFIELIH